MNITLIGVGNMGAAGAFSLDALLSRRNAQTS